MSISLMHQLRHRGMVWRSIFRGDGRILATLADGKSGDHSEVRLWDCTSGCPISPWIHLQPRSEFPSLEFSPDGTMLATGGDDRLLRFWESDSGRQCGPTIRHKSRIRCLAFHPTRRWILSGSADKLVHIWDLDSGSPVCEPLLHQSEIRSLVFGPDQNTLAVRGKGMTVQLWNSTTQRRIGHPLTHPLRVNHACFCPVAPILVTTSEDRLIYFWNSKTGKRFRRKPMAIGGWVHAVAFNYDGSLILTGNEHTPYKDRTCEAQLWDVKTGKPVGDPISHATRVILTATISPDGTLTATGGEDGRILIVAVSNGHVVAVLKHKSAVYDARFSPDGRKFVTSCTDNSARVWSIR